MKVFPIRGREGKGSGFRDPVYIKLTMKVLAPLDDVTAWVSGTLECSATLDVY